MNTYIILLRGINVGGRNILPMKELAALLEGLGLTSVKTYLNSGNVVFQSETADLDADRLLDDIRTAIEQNYGFRPQVLIRSIQDLQKAIATNPFPEGESQPKSLHFFFLESTPVDPDLEDLESIKKASERFRLVDTVFYLHAPEGIGRSKLATRVEKSLGVPATARNWRTVSKVMAMATEIANSHN